MFRTIQIYVQAKTMKRLRLVAKLFPRRDDGAGVMATDELADALINEAVLRQYPEILELETELRKVEEMFAKRIQ